MTAREAALPDSRPNHFRRGIGCYLASLPFWIAIMAIDEQWEWILLVPQLSLTVAAIAFYRANRRGRTHEW